jgi:hypothetical protein
MKSIVTNKIVMVLTVALFVLLGLSVAYWCQHQTVQVGRYTVVYYKNRCKIDPQVLPADLESLKSLPCLIRINWSEKKAPHLEQEYCYRLDRGVEKTRRIQKTR